MNNPTLIGHRSNSPELGRLGTCLSDHIEGLTTATSLDQIPNNTEAIVHCRRNDDLLPDIIAYCQQNGIDLLNLSSNAQYELPTELNFLFLECPNISIPVMRFSNDINKVCALASEPFEVRVTEHHPETKKDRAGTAQDMNDRVALFEQAINQRGYYRKTIRSVRDLAETQTRFDVPAEHEGAYAIHEAAVVRLRDSKIMTEGVVETYGHLDYAEGLQQILQTRQKIDSTTGFMLVADFYRQYMTD